MPSAAGQRGRGRQRVGRGAGHGAAGAAEALGALAAREGLERMQPEARPAPRPAMGVAPLRVADQGRRAGGGARPPRRSRRRARTAARRRRAGPARRGRSGRARRARRRAGRRPGPCPGGRPRRWRRARAREVGSVEVVGPSGGQVHSRRRVAADCCVNCTPGLGCHGTCPARAAERREELVALYKEVQGVHALPAARDPHPGGVRQRQRRRRPDVRGRGARACTRTSRASPSWAAPASCSTSCCARWA